MIKLQNVLLRYQNKKLCLKLGFLKIKAFSSPTHEANCVQSPNITNKALYLDYVEQVLKNKEKDLIDL